MGSGRFLEDAFQLAVFPFNWINKVMGDISEKVGCMLNVEASCGRTMEVRDNQAEEEATIEGMAKKWPWWSPRATEGQTMESL